MQGVQGGRLWRVAIVFFLLLVVAAAGVAWLNVRGEAPLDANGTSSAAGQVARGAYLARAGNCIGCHAAPEGGGEFAGGAGIDTPFGTVYASNITPDVKTGIGAWSSAEFWRALHHGRSKDGRLLYPAFPYPSYTRVSRDDSDALYAFLRTVPPTAQANRPHALGFPFDTQGALAVWRAMFFRPQAFAAEPGRSAAWNRGKYLVEGLGHCAACHGSRNVFGATRPNAELAGGLLPGDGWYAPSLADPNAAGVQRWPRDEVVRLLASGVSAHAVVTGPMAEVVYTSTQYLSGDDLDAMAQFLASIPEQAAPPADTPPAAGDALLQRGGGLYSTHCAACHGDRGQGVPGIYPALAGNRSVTLDSAANVVQAIRLGGFSPSTAGNPQPFGMPPFQQILGNDEIAAVSTFIRRSWGNGADAVGPLDVLRVR